jgi:DNA invertase Pin-like site-specific DNA recombinase
MKDQRHSLATQMTYYQEKFKEMGFAVADCGMLYRRNGTFERVKGIFADEGRSGTSYAKRKAFQYMLEMAKKNKFDIIYVKDISRFARNVENFTQVINMLKSIQVEVFFENVNKSSFDTDGEVLVQVLAVLAQSESRARSASTKFGIRAGHKAGYWHAKPPYGYAPDKDAPHKLRIIPEQAEVVKLVFDLCQDRKGTGAIARILNGRGIPTQKGRTWMQTQIVRILNFEIYAGRVVLHKTEVVDIIPFQKVKVPEYKQIVHNAEELRIISDEVFNKCQRIRESNRKLYETGHRISDAKIYSTLLYCGNCGGVLKRKKRHSYTRKTGDSNDIGYEWTCQMNDMYGKTRCPYRSRVVETDFADSLARFFGQLQDVDMKKIFESYKGILAPNKTKQTGLAKIDRRLDEITEEVDNIIGQVAKKRISQEDFDRYYDKLKLEKEELLAKKQVMLDQQAAFERVSTQYRTFMRRLDSAKSGEITRDKLLQLLNSVVIIGGEFEEGMLSLLEDKAKRRSYVKLALYNPVFMEQSLFDIIKYESIERHGQILFGRVNNKYPIIFGLVCPPEVYAEIESKYLIEVICWGDPFNISIEIYEKPEDSDYHLFADIKQEVIVKMKPVMVVDITAKLPKANVNMITSTLFDTRALIDESPEDTQPTGSDQ